MIGQISFPIVAETSDYIQLDICGLTANEAVESYLCYQTDKPIFLHGDWEKKGQSENNLAERIPAYVDIIQSLSQHTNVLGFTLHPMHKRKISLDAFIELVQAFQSDTDVPVLIENRSQSKIHVSTPEEVIGMSHQHPMTLDIPQLFIQASFDMDILVSILDELNWSNIHEVHLANVKRNPPRTYVGRQLDDGLLDIDRLVPYVKRVNAITLEMLGGQRVFDKNYNDLYGISVRKPSTLVGG